MSRFELNPQEMLQFVRWTLAVNKRLPKKYRDQMSHLINAYREVLYTRQISLSAGELGLRWRCPVSDLPKILYLMTRGSKTTPAMAAGITDHCWTVQELLSFHVPPSRWTPPTKRGRPSHALKRLIERWCGDHG